MPKFVNVQGSKPFWVPKECVRLVEPTEARLTSYVHFVLPTGAIGKVEVEGLVESHANELDGQVTLH